MIGATILPYGGSKYYHPGQESEADRQAATDAGFDAHVTKPVSADQLATLIAQTN